jgi:hypothetical protein
MTMPSNLKAVFCKMRGGGGEGIPLNSELCLIFKMMRCKPYN